MAVREHLARLQVKRIVDVGQKHVTFLGPLWFERYGPVVIPNDFIDNLAEPVREEMNFPSSHDPDSMRDFPSNEFHDTRIRSA